MPTPPEPVRAAVRKAAAPVEGVALTRRARKTYKLLHEPVPLRALRAWTSRTRCACSSPRSSRRRRPT
nr:hypothetical protein [Angustibacter aerolatus]